MMMIYALDNFRLVGQWWSGSFDVVDKISANFKSILILETLSLYDFVIVLNISPTNRYSIWYFCGGNNFKKSKGKSHHLNFMDKLLIFFLWRCQTLNKMLLVKSRVSQFLQVIISSDNCVYFSQLGDTIDRFMKRSKQGLPWARCWGCGRVGVQPELGWHLGQVSSPLCDFPFKIRLRILI